MCGSEWQAGHLHSKRKLQPLALWMNARAKYPGDWSLYCDAGLTSSRGRRSCGLLDCLPKAEKKGGRRGVIKKSCADSWEIVERWELWSMCGWWNLKNTWVERTFPARVWICPPWPWLEENWSCEPEWASLEHSNEAVFWHMPVFIWYSVLDGMEWV